MRKSLFLTTLWSATLAASTVMGGVTLSDMEQLGRHLYMDKDLSLNSTQSCATCHHQISGFADPTNSRDPYNTMVSLGDDGVSKGGRNAPTSAYTGFSPKLSQDALGWQGGMFWDGRAAGWTQLQDPLAEQAQGPPLNPVEMNMPDKETVVARVAAANYAPQFLKIFGDNAFVDPAEAFDNIAIAIASYERSPEVNAFSSRYDRGELSAQEQRGLALVEAKCSKCHAMDNEFAAPGPLFTDYRYENIGVPVNQKLLDDPGSVYEVPDLGLGGFLSDPAEYGKFKVPTLRNVALTAPYSHNGYFPTLTAIISFHNSRDTDNSWPLPEVSDNLNISDVGDMGLSSTDIEDIVAFLYALTD